MLAEAQLARDFICYQLTLLNKRRIYYRKLSKRMEPGENVNVLTSGYSRCCNGILSSFVYSTGLSLAN
jgi:hypothetical protein